MCVLVCHRCRARRCVGAGWRLCCPALIAAAMASVRRWSTVWAAWAAFLRSDRSARMSRSVRAMARACRLCARTAGESSAHPRRRGRRVGRPRPRNARLARAASSPRNTGLVCGVWVASSLSAHSARASKSNPAGVVLMLALHSAWRWGSPPRRRGRHSSRIRSR